MNWADFDFSAPPRGTKARLSLPIAKDCLLPLLVVRGRRAGPVLAVSAGIHGDEYEGVRAIHEVFERLDPEGMAGDLVAVPVANPAGFWRGVPNNPVDGKNLARLFPGRPNGTISEQIVHSLGQAIISRADFYLDLHSGGTSYRMPSMVGYSSIDSRSQRAAEIFGAPVIWSHASLSPGRTISFANDLGVPWLYTEARGAGRIHSKDLAMMKTGIANLLKHLAILPGQPAVGRPPRRIRGPGDTDHGLASTRAGFLHNHVQVLDWVEPGQLLGRLVDLSGDLIEEYRAPIRGVVGMTHELPLVQVGEPLFLLAEEELVSSPAFEQSPTDKPRISKHRME